MRRNFIRKNIKVEWFRFQLVGGLFGFFVFLFFFLRQTEPGKEKNLDNSKLFSSFFLFSATNTEPCLPQCVPVCRAAVLIQPLLRVTLQGMLASFD